MSVFLLIISISIFIIYKPFLSVSLNDFIVGMIGGTISYYVGVVLRTKRKKQFTRMWGLFVESVIITPMPEEVVFRFALITLIFYNHPIGILISSIIWGMFYVISESLSGLPIRYYRTKKGFLDNFISGILFSTVYFFTGWNVFTSWVAHAFHNFLIWRDIAS